PIEPSAPLTPSAQTSTLPLHDALPIYRRQRFLPGLGAPGAAPDRTEETQLGTGQLPHGTPRLPAPGKLVRPVPPHLRTLRTHLEDRKSTRLNSSHVKISYAVFCLTKKD